MLKADRLLTDTAAIVSGPRDATHGDKVRSFKHIARLWTTYLQGDNDKPVQEIAARDVAVMMTLLKIARMDFGNFNLDDYNDALGYMAIAGEIQQDAEGYEEGFTDTGIGTTGTPLCGERLCDGTCLECEAKDYELSQSMHVSSPEHTAHYYEDGYSEAYVEHPDELTAAEVEALDRGYVEGDIPEGRLRKYNPERCNGCNGNLMCWCPIEAPSSGKTAFNSTMRPGTKTAFEVQEEARQKLVEDQLFYDNCTIDECTACYGLVKDGRALPRPGTVIPMDKDTLCAPSTFLPGSKL